jgi:hypothetical protein
MGDEQEIQELKADMKSFVRTLAKGDNHFSELDKKVDTINTKLIKVDYALFGNGVNGVTQNVELILKRLDEFTHTCVGKTNTKAINELLSKIEEQRIIVEEHEQIVKTAKSVLKIFKWVGLGSLVLIGMAITNSVYNFILYLVTLL